MLTKSDIKIIRDLLKPIQNDLKEVKEVIGKTGDKVMKLERDMILIRTDFLNTKMDIHNIRGDISDIRALEVGLQEKIKALGDSVIDMKEFLTSSILNIFDWTQEIHETIVKEELPKRVKRWEDILST